MTMLRALVASLAVGVIACTAACDRDRPAEHAEDAHGHAHDEASPSWTAFGAKTQLFAEYGELKAGEKSGFRIHLTTLDGWKPVTAGEVRVLLSVGGKTVESAPVKANVPGIFGASVDVPAGASGTAQVAIELAGEIQDTHTTNVELGSGHDEHGEHDEHDEGGHGDERGHEEAIAFTLEQQWSIDFAMAPVERRSLRESFNAFGTLRPRLGGEGVVHAPVGGRVVGDDLPMLGARVEKGQELAWLLPALVDQGDMAALDLAFSEAEVRVRSTESERRRLEGLVRDGVVAERRLIEARFAEEQARAALSASKRRMRQAKGASGAGNGRGEGGVALKAPLSGTVVSVDVPPGLYVKAGQPLFRVVDADPIWLEVEIPEIHVPRLTEVKGVWFEVDGLEDSIEVVDARVSVGGVVDPHTRTLPLIVPVPNPEGRLRPGMFANAHVIEGIAQDAVAVPVEAVVFDDGLPVAFVARSGESFERRPLRLGVRDGQFVEVRGGLEPGDWVVTEGAFAVRLAALGDQEAGHGHAH